MLPIKLNKTVVNNELYSDFTNLYSTGKINLYTLYIYTKNLK